MRRLRRFRQLSQEERSLALRAFLVVAAARAALCLLPVEATRKLAGCIARGAAEAPVERIAWAVRAVSRCIPGASCLTQAIAAQALLAEAGRAAQVEIGVRKEDSQFHAHAWLVCDGEIVLGGRQAEQYKSLMILEAQE